MANKIRDIFSNDMFGMEGKINFTDSEAYKTFLSKLEEVYTEGYPLEIDGVTSITTSIHQHGAKYPLADANNLSYVIIAPAIEPVSISLDISGEEKVITLLRSETRDTFILKSEPDAMITFEFVSLKHEDKQTVKYDIQLEKAKTIEEIIEGFCIAEAFWEFFFEQDENPLDKDSLVKIQEVSKYFHNQQMFYKRLLAVSKVFDLLISTSSLKNLTFEEQHAIDELYLLICDHKIIRVSGKFTYDESTAITFNNRTTKLNIGDNLELTYLETSDYSFLGHAVKIYTANLFTNLVVKEIIKKSDGSTKVLYGDIDSKPMFVSFSAYKTEEEASEECKTIIEHVKDYKDAEYSNVYIQKYYSK